MEAVGIVMLLILVWGVLLGLRWLRNRICLNKINAYIAAINGEIDSITRLNFREEIFSVKYRRNGQHIHSVVEFNFCFDMYWD